MSETETQHLLRVAVQDIIERHITQWRNAALTTAAAGLDPRASEHELLRELRWLHMSQPDVLATTIARDLAGHGLIPGGGDALARPAFTEDTDG